MAVVDDQAADPEAAGASDAASGIAAIQGDPAGGLQSDNAGRDAGPGLLSRRHPVLSLATSGGYTASPGLSEAKPLVPATKA